MNMNVSEILEALKVYDEAVEKLQGKLDFYKDKLGEVVEENKALKKELAAKDAAIEVLENENKELKAKLQLQNENFKKLYEELQQLESRINMQKTEKMLEKTYVEKARALKEYLKNLD